MNELFDKLSEYSERFNENFPTHLANNLTTKEIIKTIDECIKNGKPLDLKADEDKDY